MTDKPTADDKAAKDTPVDIAAERKAAADAAVKADRERRSAVMALEEAKGREALAEHLLANTEMAVDGIKAALSAAPQAKAPQPDDEGEPDPTAYERSRIDALAGGGSDRPAKAKPKIDAAGIYAARNA